MIYRKALDAGEGVDAAMSIDKIEPFIKRFGKKGVFIGTSAGTEEMALALVEKSYKW